MYISNEVRKVHLEMTSRCNAACPQCARNTNGGAVNPLLKMADLTLHDVKQIFDPEFINQLTDLLVCGNYGDAIVTPECLEILQYFRTTNPDLHIMFFTNGSARKKNWWIQLAQIIGQKGFVRFAIDGLADTNHIYRRRTNFDTIIENAKIYILSGGNAEWDYIIFKHNEHQIDEARKLANDLGFQNFRLKKTSRFFDSDKLSILDKTPVENINGDIEYYLQPPSDIDNINQEIKRHKSLLDRFGSFDQYLDVCEIDCKVAKEKSVYVSAEGLVFPCCWTAHTIYTKWGIQKDQVLALLDKFGIDTINAKKIKLTDIIDGPFFKSIASSWTKNGENEGKLKVCSRICGKEFDAFTKQFN